MKKKSSQRGKALATRSRPKTKQKKRPNVSDRYKHRRNIPDPAHYSPAGNGVLRDEQLAMPFVVPRRTEPQPFLKWAGGKSALLSQLNVYFPTSIDRYLEPFLGGGALYFHLKHRFPEMRALLRDSNKELINCYRIVRDRPEDLMRALDAHAENFRSAPSDYYYAIRKQHDLTDDLARAARTIFLNKTCFNGLWRVNARGEFNTPIGSSRNLNFYSRENILAVSWALQDAQLEAQDFRLILEESQRGDFIYFDPPYFPVSVYSDFKRYTPDQFRNTDQVALANTFRELDRKGCRLLLSNSNHPQILELYSGFRIEKVSAPRFVNCKANGRGPVTELIVTNFKIPAVLTEGSKPEAEPVFPETKYMGSKQRLLPFILRHLRDLEFKSFLDAFSGSGCVAYAVKRSGASVHANDFLTFCYHIGKATIENNGTKLTEDDEKALMRRNPRAQTFVRDTYSGIYFDHDDCEFLDNFWTNLEEIDSPLKRSLALASITRACMKKRPRGLFTFTGRKGWDNRQDLRLTMREQFLIAASAFNGAVFSNGKQNRATNLDVFQLNPNTADLVYFDPPYISPYSDCDYTRRYHFVEGFCHYWNGRDILEHTSTKKFRSYETAFASRQGAAEAFGRLFNHFRASTLVVSYSSNCVPTKSAMIDLLRTVKKEVVVYEAPHRYHHGNHGHKVGDNMNEVTEFLFVAK